MKIVINNCWGGFSLSRKAYKELGLEWDGFGGCDIDRNDSRLVTVVETLGEEASGECAQLKVVKIPDGVDWTIRDYGGMETIEEVHRTWR